MAQFQAFDRNVEVSGQSALAVIEAMSLFQKMTAEILARHGIAEVKTERWYPQQPYLNFYREIAEKVGARTLKNIGRYVPEHAFWPPEIDTLEKALASLDVAYHMNHRGGEIGYYRFEKTGTHSGKMICYNPYPCPFDHGLIEAVAQKFAAAGARVRVTHDDPQRCRLNGAVERHFGVCAIIGPRFDAFTGAAGVSGHDQSQRGKPAQAD